MSTTTELADRIGTLSHRAAVAVLVQLAYGDQAVRDALGAALDDVAARTDI